MQNIINAALDRSRTTVLILLFLIISGAISFFSIPKEAQPDVAIPIIYVSIPYEGIAPDDAVRLLVRPMEKELKSIEGVKEMRAVGSEGHASVTLEFDAGFDSDKALQDVREKVDIAKSKLPAATEEPEIHEVNVALFPVLSIALAGPLPEREMLRIARDLKDSIEGLSGVLEVAIGGERDELMEILVEPQLLEAYELDFVTVINSITANNQLVAAGAVESRNGRQVLKVPGVVEDVEDLLRMPVKNEGDTVVTLGDVAQVRSTFKDAESYARVGGGTSMVLEVKKKVGANIIETIEQVQALVTEHQQQWPPGLEYSYTLDQSTQIRNMLRDLLNNVLSGIVLVMIIMLAVMGPRPALLVGLAIPGSFLAGILVLDLLGYTLNIVVLFSLILVVGMLVDGAIVVIELADRRLNQGMKAKEAFSYAASRMAWPVISATLTTLVVFMPLMFWPGIVGQFMKYLPATVLICLTASLFMALIFMPVLGGLISRPPAGPVAVKDEYQLPDGVWNRRYRNLLAGLLAHPGKTFLATLALLVLTYVAYGRLGHGVEFFPSVEPEQVLVRLHARGDLSIQEKDALLREVEARVLDMPELDSVYAQSFISAGSERAEDVVGEIQFQLVDWSERRPAADILAEMAARSADIAGVELEFRKAQNGPTQGKPIQLQVSGYNNEQIYPVVEQIRAIMAQQPGFVAVEDNRPLPGIEWRLNVDREEAARYGADIGLVGNAVQLITGGIKVSDYRPDTADEEVDIRVRFPADKRHLDQLMQMQLRTTHGMVALSNFVELEPGQKTGTLHRVDGRQVVTIQSEAAEGVLVNDLVVALQKSLNELSLPQGVRLNFKGEDEQQRETGAFLGKAFMIALFLMGLILVTQFNSIYQALLVLSAIVFSTAGVLLGLLITAQPFGIVMVGLGIIALAGIVVNNNIVLIDCYNELRKLGYTPFQAALDTGSLRLRPVLLTAITTVLGLMPMVLAMNIDFINRSISFGAPSTQWWRQLASAIAGGLGFATALTLLLTPCLLVLGERWFQFGRRQLVSIIVNKRRELARAA